MPIARHRYAHTDARLPSARIPQFVVCDLEAELPTVDVGEGDIAYAKDSDKLFKRTAAAWLEISSGGSVAALDDVGDVNAPTPGDGEMLTWNVATSKWIPAAHAGTNTHAQIDTHLASTSNPHSVTAAQAGALAAAAFSGLAKITVGTSAPGSPGTGDLWVDTN